ncbi:MAG: zf-TFIIB domain-containing protein [Candidatus Lindowbacteria bacterium]|nr:zf-TFIIB domain-containing protein [Candidatus Lindowbacteria bacterium]
MVNTAKNPSAGIRPTKPPKSYMGQKSLLNHGIQKPSDEEEKYFVKGDLEKLKKFEEERKAHLEAEEKEHARQLHYRKCPKCYGDLEEIVFKKKVKIDRCRGCNGVWLDNGELEILAGHEESFLTSFLSHLIGGGKGLR